MFFFNKLFVYLAGIVYAISSCYSISSSTAVYFLSYYNLARIMTISGSRAIFTLRWLRRPIIAGLIYIKRVEEKVLAYLRRPLCLHRPWALAYLAYRHSPGIQSGARMHTHAHKGRRIIHTYTLADTHAPKYTNADTNTDARRKYTRRQHTCKHTKLQIKYNYNYIPSKRANVVSYPQVNSCYFAICIVIPTVIKQCTCCTANHICSSN